ncbi:MAG: glutamate racemase [Moraxella sp.]|nr:glutamate racemase [Moraxella sp.]
MIIQHPDFKDDPTAPIGVFDSGVGGLSVYLHLKDALPNEHFIYYADTANVPYGGKSGDEILLLTLQAVARLCKRGCKLIVIACNSASAHALHAVRKRCAVPIVGLVPAVKPACIITKTHQIAVLATRATLDGHLLNDVIDDVATPQGVVVHKHFEPALVPWVESGMPTDGQVATWLTAQTKQWADDGIDVVVLGCTHYPFFRKFLQDYIDKQQLNITLMDSGRAIAQRVSYLLTAYQLNNTSTDNSGQSFKLYATRLNDETLQIIKNLTGHDAITVINWYNNKPK